MMWVAMMDMDDPTPEDRTMTRPNMEQGYSTREVADATGASYRQIDYWCRTGLVVPDFAEATGSGTRRRFSGEDLALIRDVMGLMARGFRLRQAFDEAYAGMGYRTLRLSEMFLDSDDSTEVELVQRALRFTVGEDFEGGTGTEAFSDEERLTMLDIADRLDEP